MSDKFFALHSHIQNFLLSYGYTYICAALQLKEKILIAMLI